MAFALTTILVLIALASVSLSLAFARHRLPRLRDAFARIWSRRRREILHLECLNGFDFFRDRLHDWSRLILIAAVVSVLPVFIWDPDLFLLAGALVTWGFTFRHFARYYVASSRMKQASLPLEYDGFGSYARAASDWRIEAREAKENGKRCAMYGIVWTLMTLMAIGSSL